MIVEGYFHTGNLKKYVRRLLIFAILSEIPFNLMLGGRVFYPIQQNVLWSFLISLGMIHWNERAKASGKIWLRVLVGIASVLLGYILGLVTFVDYYFAGVLTALVFYFFRGRKWWCLIGQLICLWYINVEMLGGIGWDVSIGTFTFFFTRQGLALLALIPIWLYRGRQGYHSKWFQYVCYGFYPVHLLIIGVIGIF
jgi:hypothetical protein